MIFADICCYHKEVGETIMPEPEGLRQHIESLSARIISIRDSL